MSIRAPAVVLPPGATLPPPPLPTANERWALFLDVDGTLLEFADDPRAVVASTGLIVLLQRLHHAVGGALALVSGRTVAELGRMFQHPPWTLVGLHGLELRLADGSRRHFAVTPADQARVEEVAHALASRFAGVQIELKGSAVALHCRRAPGQFAALLAAAASAAGQLPGYEVQPGNLVVELKPEGADKGQALDELLGTRPFSGRRPVYLGDDLTDEYAFVRVNAAGGLSVRVGAREPTAAHFGLADPPAVAWWLRGVLTTGNGADA